MSKKAAHIWLKIAQISPSAGNLVMDILGERRYLEMLDVAFDRRSESWTI